MPLVWRWPTTPDDDRPKIGERTMKNELIGLPTYYHPAVCSGLQLTRVSDGECEFQAVCWGFDHAEPGKACMTVIGWLTGNDPDLMMCGLIDQLTKCDYPTPTWVVKPPYFEKVDDPLQLMYRCWQMVDYTDVDVELLMLQDRQAEVHMVDS